MNAETRITMATARDTFATTNSRRRSTRTLLKFDLDKYPNVTGDLAQSYKRIADK